MLMDYKNIGDTLTTAELNAYASLLAHNKVLKDSFKLKNGVINGVYGNYEFDLSNASIVDNGILITDETLSNNITVKLSNPTQYATYTLHFSVVRYGDASILDEDNQNIETFDLTVDLIADTIVNIPLETLQEYDVILFDSSVTIAHNKPEIVGAYVTDLDITANPNIIQTNETSVLEITATDLEHLPVQNKSIQLLKNNVLVDTLVTDSQGKATKTITGTAEGELEFIAKYLGSVTSETLEIKDCIFYDNNSTDTTSKYYCNTTNGTSKTYDSTNQRITVTCGTNANRNYIYLRTYDNADLLAQLTGKTIKFEVDLDNLNSKTIEIGIRQTVAGTTTTNTLVSTTTDGTLESNSMAIDPSATQVILIINATNTGGWESGDTYYVQNLKIYPVS